MDNAVQANGTSHDASRNEYIGHTNIAYQMETLGHESGVGGSGNSVEGLRNGAGVRECERRGAEEGKDAEGNQDRIVLVGSGDMTRAMVTCLVAAGHRPVVATRNPARARTWVGSDEADVVKVEDGVMMGDVVVVAIPAKHHHTLPAHLLEKRVVVDISNRAPEDPPEPSLAQKLQALLPHSHVVKAFNTVSAYVLQRGQLHRGREVPMCGDTGWAKQRVADLVRDMGLVPVDRGGLKAAREIEDIPLAFFSEWKLAAILAGVIFLFFWILSLFRGQICPNLDGNDGTWDWSLFEVLPLNNTQFSLAFTACTLLLICYIPGMIAAYLQLWRGTKYSHFPTWLDTWLKARKQLGLLALLLGATHGCMAIFTKISWGMGDEWWQQTYVACGVLLLAVLVILGITSLPSVSTTLTWREFSVVQRYLGWSSVVLVTVHLTIATHQGLLNPPACVVIPSGAQILVPLCFLTLLVKIALLVPCVDSHLTKIRAGYERTKASIHSLP